jgi:hypothetical protein
MKYLKQHPINDKAQKLSKLKKEDARKAKEKKMSAEKDLAEKPKTGRATTDPSNKKLDGEKFLAESKDENTINWKEVESKWDKWYEESNNEADYDEEYDAMKSFVKAEVEWSKVKREYFDYIEETNNEDDGDDKFKNFKKFVNNHLK